MINKTTYHNLLTSNQKISVEDMQGLGELVTDFPYSQNIRQLYLKALYQNESVKFETELKKTAAYTSNRSHLKEFILNDSFEEEQEVIFTSFKKETADVAPENKFEKIEEELNDKNVEDKLNKQKETITTDESHKQETVTNIIDPSLNDEFLSQAINASISMEVGWNNKDKEGKTEPSPPQKEKANEVSQKRSFIQWIKLYDQEQQTKAIDRSEFKKKASLLIDEFISNQPRISPKKDFYSAINMARKSLQDSDEVVSETLAQIIFKQGNHQKAIKMYQSLSMKYPEKKAYFADRIEKIKISQIK
ncbi:MAG: hypothetical protein ACJAZ2_001761 [Glaciecola sp.]